MYVCVCACLIMLKSPESSFPSQITAENGRRRSTFYVPLITTTSTVLPSSTSKYTKKIPKTDDEYNPDLSACSFDWSLNCSGDLELENHHHHHHRNDSHNDINDTPIKNKRYGVVLDGSISARESSTPIRIAKSRSRSNILNLPDKTLTSPVKEKSKTLPQNLNALSLNTFPPKNTFLLKSTPKMSLNYSSDSATLSPRKSSLSFIRRAHSTKLTRNNSLLKSLTTKCVDHSIESVHSIVNELSFDRLAKNWGHDKFDEIIREIFFKKSSSSASDCDVNSSCCSGDSGNNKTTNGNSTIGGVTSSSSGVHLSRQEDEESAVYSGKYFFYVFFLF